MMAQLLSEMVPAAWIRTCDLSLTRGLLCLLSYAGEIG